MAIAEGIENALTAFQATGLGVWAAGCASRMTALADAIPDWIDCVTIIEDDDPDGHRFAREIRHRIEALGMEAHLWRLSP
jgi:hypothetical protein